MSKAKIAMYREEAHIGGNSHWERGSLDRRDFKKVSVLGAEIFTTECTFCPHGIWLKGQKAIVASFFIHLSASRHDRRRSRVSLSVAQLNTTAKTCPATLLATVKASQGEQRAVGGPSYLSFVGNSFT